MPRSEIYYQSWWRQARDGLLEGRSPNDCITTIRQGNQNIRKLHEPAQAYLRHLYCSGASPPIMQIYRQLCVHAKKQGWWTNAKDFTRRLIGQWRSFLSTSKQIWCSAAVARVPSLRTICLRSSVACRPNGTPSGAPTARRITNSSCITVARGSTSTASTSSTMQRLGCWLASRTIQRAPRASAHNTILRPSQRRFEVRAASRSCCSSTKDLPFRRYVPGASCETLRSYLRVQKCPSEGRRGATGAVTESRSTLSSRLVRAEPDGLGAFGASCSRAA